MFKQYTNGCNGHFEELKPKTPKFGVIIDRAHGINTPGKCSPDAANGLKDSPYYYYEWQWSSIICTKLAERLKNDGFRVEFTVDPKNEREPGLSVRADRANKIIKDNPDIHWIFISMHSNAAGGDGHVWSNAKGYSLYTTKGITNSDILADCIVKKAAEALPLYSKNIRKYKDKYLERDMEENWTVIYKTNCPAVLCENFFHTTKSEVAWLKSERGQEVIVDFHAKGIADYFNLQFPDEI